MSRLSSSAIRNLARNLFSSFYERGISANQALAELRELGLGYRRSDFLSDFRAGAERFKQATKVRYVNLDKTPSEAILQEAYHGVPDKYSFVFKVKGFNELTGSRDEQYFFYHRNTLRTRGEMEDEALEWFLSQSERYGLVAESVNIVEGFINPVWS